MNPKTNKSFSKKLDKYQSIFRKGGSWIFNSAGSELLLFFPVKNLWTFSSWLVIIKSPFSHRELICNKYNQILLSNLSFFFYRSLETLAFYKPDNRVFSLFCSPFFIKFVSEPSSNNCSKHTQNIQNRNPSLKAHNNPQAKR